MIYGWFYHIAPSSLILCIIRIASFVFGGVFGGFRTQSETIAKRYVVPNVMSAIIF